MPPGPPNLGDNRFATLANASSPKRKKAKSKNSILFPELPKLQPPNPRYVILETTDPEKPISKYSCFAVYRSIQLISKDVTSVSQLRNGNLLLLVNSKETAEKFVSAKDLFGLCKINCRLHDNLNFTKGTIYAPYLNDISEDEIIKELADQGVVAIHKFKKPDNTFTGVLLLTFDLYHLPDKIKISWNSVNVRQYYPNPMRCKRCQKLGHTAKYCKNTESCLTCNLPPHPEVCSRIQCANCLDNHPSNSNKCPRFIQQKELLKIKIQNKCSMNEARRIQRSSNPSLPLIPTFSSIVSANTTTNSKIFKNEKIVKEKNEFDITIKSTNNNRNSLNSPASSSPLLQPTPSSNVSSNNMPSTSASKQPTLNNNLLNKIQSIINKPRTTKSTSHEIFNNMDFDSTISDEE